MEESHNNEDLPDSGETTGIEVTLTRKASRIRETTNTDDHDLDKFFDKYDPLSNELKSKLINYGATFDKLLMLNDKQILNYSQVDATMTTDLLLLIQALNDYKTKKTKKTNKNKNNFENTNTNINNRRASAPCKPMIQNYNSNESTIIVLEDGTALARQCTQDLDIMPEDCTHDNYNYNINGDDHDDNLELPGKEETKNYSLLE